MSTNLNLILFLETNMHCNAPQMLHESAGAVPEKSIRVEHRWLLRCGMWYGKYIFPSFYHSFSSCKLYCFDVWWIICILQPLSAYRIWSESKYLLLVCLWHKILDISPTLSLQSFKHHVFIKYKWMYLLRSEDSYWVSEDSYWED